MTPDLAGHSGPVIYLLVFVVLFVESGVLAGLFLPGDSLLFGAGLLAGSGRFGVSVLGVAATVWVAATLGGAFGYALGRRCGRRCLLRGLPRRGGRLVELAERLYLRHGWFAVVVARWIPGVRAVVPALGGIGRMRYGSFLTANLLGGFLWGVGLVVLGYLSFRVPEVRELSLLAMAASIVATVGYTVYSWVRRRRFEPRVPATMSGETPTGAEGSR